MLPPTPVRRLLLVPLVMLIAGTMAALAPPVALLSVAFNALRRRTRPGRPRRSRLLRVIILGLAWSTGEIAALTVFLGLWLTGIECDAGRRRTRHCVIDRCHRALEKACVHSWATSFA